jgi:hypothetical protein
MMTRGSWLVAAVVVFGASTALAETYPDTYPVNAHEKQGGMTVEANGGILSYPGQGAAVFQPGGQYGAAVGVTSRVIGLELGYQGAAYGVERGGNLIENGGQALVKLGRETGGFMPYALGGYNLSWLTANGTAKDNGISNNVVSKIPVGAGVDYRIPSSGSSAVTVGARGTYNFVMGNDSFVHRSASADDQIGATLQVGGSF